MDEMLSPEARSVVATFVAAYPRYVRTHVSEVVAQDPLLAAAIDRGGQWLRDTLVDVLSQEFRSQRRGPLEVFQESMRFPTEVLVEADIESVERPDAERAALPGDQYGLAPASSQDLGNAAWRAHVAWGIAKARVVSGATPRRASTANSGEPFVVVVGGTKTDYETIEMAVRAAPMRAIRWRNPAAIHEGLASRAPYVALVDLEYPGAQRAIADLAAAGATTAAFGDDVDDIASAAAMSLGAAVVIERTRLRREVERLLPTKA